MDSQPFGCSFNAAGNGTKVPGKQSKPKPLCFVCNSVPPPVFKEKLQSREVQEEDPAVLSCQLPLPSAEVKWKRAPGDLPKLQV